VATGRRSEVRVREREVGVGKRPRALAIFREQRGGLQNRQAGARSRAEAAEHALRDACPVKRGEEGKRGHLLRTLIVGDPEPAAEV
jgi:hypothetical protein